MTMLDEVRSMPEVARAALDRGHETLAAAARRIREADPTVLVTVARGSSDNAAEVIGRSFARRLGLMPLSLPPALVTIDRAPLRWRGCVVLAISQSGRSPDLIAPVEAARSGGALTLALVNDVESPLAAAAEIVLPIDAGPERAIAATKSYVMTLVQAMRLLAAIDGDAKLADGLSRLPEAFEAALSVDWSAGLEPLRTAGTPFVIGRGAGLGTARELALKFKELCGLHAEAISAAEVMHGPKALIGPTDPVVAVVPDDGARPAMEDAVAALAEQTSNILVAGPGMAGAALTLPVPPAPLPDLSNLVLSAASYPFIAALAHARGLDPDTPKHIRKVTETR